MGTLNKKKSYQAAVIAVTAEAIIAFSLILIPGLTVFEKLKIFGGLFIIIKSVFFFFLLNERLVNEYLLQLSLISIWIIPSFLAGLALLVSVWPSLDWLGNICGGGLVLSLLIGNILLVYALKIRKLKVNKGHNERVE
jgi:hypothetical protein